jgi:hypothetical protein
VSNINKPKLINEKGRNGFNKENWQRKNKKIAVMIETMNKDL